MKRTRLALAALLLLIATPMTSCATSHLVRWSLDKTSVYREHDTELGKAVLKPGITVIGLPIAAAWDVATLPFQAIWGIYPYGERYLVPAVTDRN